MIERERLEELIKQGATIWSNDWEEEIVLDKDHCVIFHCTRYNNEYDCDILSVDEGDGYVNNYIIRALEEDVESAKWKLEFGNIERTEKLTLPTWEEAQDKRFYYINNFQSLTGLRFFISIYKFTNDFEIHCSHGSKIGDYHIERHFDLRDKKQYLEACRLAKKLFLGERK